MLPEVIMPAKYNFKCTEPHLFKNKKFLRDQNLGGLKAFHLQRSLQLFQEFFWFLSLLFLYVFLHVQIVLVSLIFFFFTSLEPDYKHSNPDSVRFCLCILQQII